MRRDPRDAVLFEPLRRAPVASGNRRRPALHGSGTGTRDRSARS